VRPRHASIDPEQLMILGVIFERIEVSVARLVLDGDCDVVQKMREFLGKLEESFFDERLEIGTGDVQSVT
jgi:ubiquinone biosynthesis protein UbiJ